MPFKPYIQRLKFVPFSYEKVRLLVLHYIICNILVILTGVAVWSLLDIDLVDEEIKDFVTIDQRVTNTFQKLLRISSVIAILTGLIALLAHLLGYPGRLTFTLSYLLLCPFGLLTIGIGESASIPIRDSAVYRRMILLDSHFYIHRDKFMLVSEKTSAMAFHEKFKCCGMFSIKDWYFSRCNCIAKSCCRTNNEAQCDRLFISPRKNYKHLGLLSPSFESFESSIWDESCMEHFQSFLSAVKGKAFTILGIFSVIYWLLVMWHFHLTVVLRDLAVSPGGYIQLQIFKGHCPTSNIRVKKEYKKFIRIFHTFSSDTESESDPENTEIFDVSASNLMEGNKEESEIDISTTDRKIQ